VLAHAGFEVHEAADGAEGLRLARSLRPDVVLLDLLLPHVDGWTIASQLKADPAMAQTRVIAFSATAYPKDRARALEVGCDAFLTKPADLRSLVALVRRALANEPTTRAPEAPR